MLDRDGQPIARGINAHRNLLKSVESLLGICRGLLADNVLSPEEITFLDTWLRDNAEVASYWPGNVIARRVREVLADGVVTAEEADDLKGSLEQIIGGGLQQDGAASGLATRLPVDRVTAVEFPGRTFCLTGKFLYGSRKTCQTAVEQHGGVAIPRVTKELDYLVIGTLASRDWISTSYGRKIEAAVKNKQDGSPVRILAEEDWVQFL